MRGSGLVEYDRRTDQEAAMNEYYLFGVTYFPDIEEMCEPHCRFCGNASRGTYYTRCTNNGWWLIQGCWTVLC